jgi:dipeptidase
VPEGIAAGPFGNLARYLGSKDPSGYGENPNNKLESSWECPMLYTGYVFINQNKRDCPFPLNVVSWIVLDTPAESVFISFAVSGMPVSYVNGGNTKKFSINSV